MLGDGALALFVAYAIVVAFDILPPRLTDPAWMTKSALSLTGNMVIPVAALAFLHLAAWMTPMNNLIQARRNFFGSLARWAMIGFLLLIPLVGFATFTNIKTVKIQNQIQINTARDKTRRLVQAIEASTGSKQLQATMIVLQGPNIPAEILGQPLPLLKRATLSIVNEAYKSFLLSIKTGDSDQFFPLYVQAIRSSLLSMVGAVAFAALSWNPIKQQSLLSEIFLGDLNQLKLTLNPKRLIANFKLRQEQSSLSKDAREKVRELQKMRQAEAKLNAAATRKQNLERKRDMERYIKEEKRKRSNRID